MLNNKTNAQNNYEQLQETTLQFKLLPGERLDDLKLDGLKIIQKVGGYGFTSDSVLLANFVKTKHSDKCVEIGTGSGIISILVNYKEKPKQIIAFEIQKGPFDLAVRNFKNCKMDNTICVINDKIQNWKNHFSDGEIDVVFSNPPYFKYDQNMSGRVEEKVVSRSDKFLSLSDFLQASSQMLKFGGKLFFVYDSARFVEATNLMKTFNLAPKRVFFVHPNQGKNSTVFLCEAVKGGKDSCIILPPLFTNNLDGDYVQTIQKLY